MFAIAPLRSWGVALILLAPGLAHAAGPSARWAGQDGRDFVGGEPGPAPSGYQDIHVALAGLPPGRALAKVELKGHGRGLWNNEVTNKAAVHVERGAKPGTFDLYFEPFERETGREFELKWQLDDGQAGGFYFKGGKADPNLRVGGQGVEAKWVAPGTPGTPPSDRTNPSMAVGPDGVADAHLALAKLPPQAEVREVAVALKGGATWRSGLNPQGTLSAEFARHRDDPTRGDLYFSPTPGLKEPQPLDVTITYADGRSDATTVAVGKLPDRRALAVARVVDVPAAAAKARWLGQRPGAPLSEVRVEVTGLPAGRTIVAAALSDGVVGTWRYRRDDSIRFEAGPDARPLRLDRSAAGKLELAFAPVRDESGATMTLRLLDTADREDVVRFPGNPVDFAQLAPPLPPAAAQAKPGDDLPALLTRGGTVTLAPGVYELDRPLDLPRPARLVGPGATLRFAQRGGQPWTSAITIRAGGTRLEGFAVRFAGPVRWDQAGDHGAAVIATPDGESAPRHRVELVDLDLAGPPAASGWEEAIGLTKFLTASSGRVERCKLKGGTVLFGGGPWAVVDNEYLGAQPNTFSRGVFAALYPHDLTLASNRAHDVGPAGKTWRFLVLAQRGANDRIVGNVVDGGIGPHQGDAHPHDNSPELILTEAYRLHFEGKPAGLSPDGRVLAIAAPQGGPAATGDAVAILAGSQAGQWRTIAQPLGDRLYLLDEPIAADTTAVSLATGFVRETFEGNTVDCRGSTIAAPLVLAGNLFGVRVVGNKLYGGGETLRLHASPTEAPIHWGWSHAPFLGATVADNLIVDPAGGPTLGLGVEHGPAIKTNQGRTYMSLVFSNNTIRWTKPAPAAKFLIGYAPTLDPAELMVTESGTKLEGAPADAVRVVGAKVNGIMIRDAPLGRSSTDHAVK